MSLTAHITIEGAVLKAEVSDGRTLFAPDPRKLAAVLVNLGIHVDHTHCGDWRDGDMALMAGTAVALKVEMRRLMSVRKIGE